MAQLYKADGTIEEFPEPANGTDYTLEEMRAAIGGGWIEALGLTEGRLMIIDEEGKLKELSRNEPATLLWREMHSSIVDYISGDALVIEASQMR